jgi:glycosyltransferase involved in cell wall biosynthesis
MPVVVTIPAYNEEQTIGHVISGIRKAMAKYPHKILVVDDGSTDRTARLAKAEGAIVISHPKNYGLAEAFKTAMKKALELKADMIVHIDADCQYKAEEIPKLIRKAEEGNDLVLGSRFLGTIEHMPRIKRLGNRLFSKVISRLTGIKVTDSQTGFRAFTWEVARLPMHSTYSYTQEQIIRAVKEKMRVAEVPVTFARRDGDSRLIKNSVGYATRTAINIFRVYRDYQPLKFFGAAGLALFGLGFLIGLHFIYLHLTTGISGHPGLLFLMLVLLVVGIQVILFGFLADVQRK